MHSSPSSTARTLLEAPSSSLSASTTPDSSGNLPPPTFGKAPSDPKELSALAVDSVEAQLRAMREEKQAPSFPLGVDASTIPEHPYPVFVSPMDAPAGAQVPAAAFSANTSGTMNSSDGMINVEMLMDESMKSMASLLLDDNKSIMSDRTRDALDNTNFSIDMSLSDGTMGQMLAEMPSTHEVSDAASTEM